MIYDPKIFYTRLGPSSTLIPHPPLERISCMTLYAPHKGMYTKLT